MPNFNNKRMVITIFLSILVVYLFSVVYAIITQKPFYADGSNFFLSILKNESFVMHYPARQYGQYFTEFPTVLGIKLFHLRNINTLSYIFGTGLFLPPIMCLLICFYIVRDININYMIFPIVSLFGITQNILFIMVSDCIVITYVFWPILFFIIFVKEYKLLDIILLMLMALIFMRSYESASLLGLIILAVLFVEIYQNWKIVNMRTNLIWVLLTLIIMNSIVIAVMEIMNPTYPENKATFLQNILTVLEHYQAMLSITYIALISVCLLVKRFSESVYFKFIAAILFLITIYFSFLPVIRPDLIRPWLQHLARSFHIYMIPLLSLVAYLVLKGIVRVSKTAWKEAFILCAFLVIGQLTWQILITNQWDGFRQIFKEELATKQGYVRFEETRLINNRIGNQLVRVMAWPWSNPILSILWSRNLDVRTIIANPKEYQGSEPFNPQDIQSLPKIEHFGFSYKKYIEYVKLNNSQ
jgi:hypothetical protein